MKKLESVQIKGTTKTEDLELTSSVKGMAHKSLDILQGGRRESPGGQHAGGRKLRHLIHDIYCVTIPLIYKL